MKKILSILLLVLVFEKTHSQVVFCPPGAEWHYNFYKSAFPGPSSIVNEQIKYERDSILGNDTIKVVSHTVFFKRYGCYWDKKFTSIKQRGDTVFFRNESTQHSWQILYNYAALPGQGWQNTIRTLPVSTATTLVQTNSYSITVDSVKNIVVNSFNLRRLYVRYTGYIYNIHSTALVLNSDTAYIDERMGCNQFLFNFYNRRWHSECYDNAVGFLCYKDNYFGVKQLTEKPCDYSAYEAIAENKYQNNNFKIYPNPSNDFFTIRSENEQLGECTVSVKDLYGREIKHVILNNLNSEPVKIDITDLANGIYILSISNKGKIIFNEKLVKSE